MPKFTQEVRERPKPVSCSCTVPTSTSVLDTFSLSAPSTPQETALKKLRKRAQSKFVTNVVAFPLAQLRSPLQKQYKRSTNCAGEVTETPGKFTSLYCNCRWCLVCSKIRTGRLIVGYLPAIEAMQDKWFLTLSRPNVAGPKLADEIQYYLATARLIQRHLREKRKLDFSSLRKIECTYNEAVNTYHPHFHFIFDSWEAGNAFLHEWLARNPTAKLDKGNQLKKADNKSVVELFKYFTKVVSKSSTKVNGVATSDYRIHLQALDTMFQAMAGVRTFQPCGVIKFVSEDIEPEQAVESGRAEVNHWKWLAHDWVNVETQAALTGFVPSENQQRIAKQVVYPVNVVPVAPTDSTPFYVDKETGEVVPAELVDVQRMRNNIQFAKIYPEQPESTKRRNADSGLVPVAWEDIQQHEREEPAQPVLAVAPPAPAQLGLFSQPAAAPAAPIKFLSPPLKKPALPRGLATAQPAAYFQVQPSESLLFSSTA